MKFFRLPGFLLLLGFGCSLGPLNSITFARTVCPGRFMEIFHSYEAKDPLQLPMTIGIEVEGALAGHQSLEPLADRLLERVRKRYPDAQIKADQEKDAYEIAYRRKDGVIKKLRIFPDHSIEATGLGPEITSPILDSPEDFECFQDVLASAKHFGVRADPGSAGVHIHVGFGDPRSGEIVALGAVFKEIEENLKALFSSHPDRSDFMGTMKPEVLEAILRAPPGEIGTFHKVINRQDRKRALNFQALNKHGTVEFRLFNSTLDLAAIELMHDFASKLVHAIRTKNPELVRYLTEEKGEVQLSKIASILHMKLLDPQSQTVLLRIAKEADRSMGPHLQGQADSHLLRNLGILLGMAVVSNAVVSNTVAEEVRFSYE